MVCTTFHEATQMKGLLNFEEEWEYTMTEAAVWQMPTQLRDMYLRILVYSSVANPVTLWTSFKKDLQKIMHIGFSITNKELLIVTAG